MKIVVHFGKAKTGTTALQFALLESRATLGAHGVLYPRGAFRPENHHLLTALFLPAEEVSPDIRSFYGQDAARMRRAAQAMWTQIKREAERTRPKLVILSSEYFYARACLERFGDFVARLSELSADLEPCVYFREPAAHYLSLVQQDVKQARPPAAPDGAEDRRVAPAIEAAFGRPILAGNADRDALAGGDVVADFLARAVAPVVGPVAIPSVRRNESISAEAMAILDRYRALRDPSRPRLGADLELLQRLVAAAERKAGRSNRPKLRPELAAAIRRGAGDLPWLRDRYGLVFAGVDYAAIDDAPVALDRDRIRIEDIVAVDAEWRDALLAEALAEGLAARRGADRLSRKLAHVAAAARASGGEILAALRRGPRRT